MTAVGAAAATVAALAGFEAMTTARLRSLLTGRDAAVAYALAAGEVAPTPALAREFQRYPHLAQQWQDSARRITPAQMEERCRCAGIGIALPGDEIYPEWMLTDPRRPEVLFLRGSVAALARRRVAIVGTRNPTRRGADTARRFGRELTEADVGVVSGLALGVDGAAHRGALECEEGGGSPIGVVANGLDHPYPRRHRDLWEAVAHRGLLISEWPPGVKPEPYRFPQRNRILAALAELIVVVESRERGGSLITAREGAERGIDVYAVPGPIDQRASAGTNALLSEGAHPVLDTETMLVALGLDHRRSGRQRVDPRVEPTGLEADVLNLLTQRPHRVESVAVALSIELSQAAMALARLERDGWATELGGWFEAIDVNIVSG